MTAPAPARPEPPFGEEALPLLRSTAACLRVLGDSQTRERLPSADVSATLCVLAEILDYATALLEQTRVA